MDYLNRLDLNTFRKEILRIARERPLCNKCCVVHIFKEIDKDGNCYAARKRAQTDRS